MKKIFKGVALAAALALGLSACGADPTADEETADASTGDDSDTILIGGSLNLDGEQSAYDALILEGIEVAIAEANENGGVLGKEIVWENLNGGSDTTTIANNAEVLIERGADAIIAPADFDYGSPAARAAQDAGLVGISPGATSPSYGSDVLGDKQFTIGYWNTAMGAAAAEWAYEEQGFENAYVVTYDGLDYTESLSRYFMESWENAGGTVVAEDKYSGGGDFSAQLQRLRNEIDNVDVIYISVYNPDLAQFIREIRASGIDTMILGGDGYDGPELSESLGEEHGNNIYYVTHAFLSEEANPNIPEFIETFEEHQGSEPLSILEALGYDTATALLEAIEAVGTTDGDALAEQMTSMEFDLLSGQLSWASAEDGHEPQKETAIVYLDEGQPVFDKWFQPEWTPEP
ncbi:MAG TPA: ABC transporter substrate-binding protein [Wenzhouxiangella sp.]|nr:ABC transporter substrate-binding protein [Wenzhouxiangella sp.]